MLWCVAAGFLWRRRRFVSRKNFYKKMMRFYVTMGASAGKVRKKNTKKEERGKGELVYVEVFLICLIFLMGKFST